MDRLGLLFGFIPVPTWMLHGAETEPVGGAEVRWVDVTGCLTFVGVGAALIHLLLQILHLLRHLPAPLLRLLQLTADRQIKAGED